MRHRHVLLAFTLLSTVAPAAAQDRSAPHAAPLYSEERARSYALENRSDDTIVSARAHMTNNDQRDLVWGAPVRPQKATEIAVPANECVTDLTVQFKSGRTLKTVGTPDCRNNRITVTDNSIEFKSDASNRLAPK